jgi:hypothetical protein
MTRSIDIGPLSTKEGSGKHYTPQRIVFDTPTRIVAATSTEPLVLAHEWRGSALRPGALEFLRHPSRGLSC